MDSLHSPKRLRPWFLVAAMSLTWVVGVFGATSGCSNLAYLRGSQSLPSGFEADAADPGAHPWVRSGIVRERARLEAIGREHRLAFPLSVAKLLLSALLVLASGAALAGRRSARTFALQVLAANAALAAIDWVLMEPVRLAMAQAVAADAVDHGVGTLPDLDRAGSVELYRSVHLWAERFRFALLEIAVFGSAAAALTRQRTKDFFQAVARAADADSPGSDDPPP